jgi:thiosulfate/3-mercaptopyruvate sulfurtransferase
VEPGHIPGSKNLPQAELFNADNSWKQGEELRLVFERSGVDLGKPMVTTCGSGVTAAVLLFGARLLGKDDVRLYDGSWSEWGADPSTPKAVGRQ